jgi:hypothetical protein
MICERCNREADETTAAAEGWAEIDSAYSHLIFCPDCKARLTQEEWDAIRARDRLDEEAMHAEWDTSS